MSGKSQGKLKRARWHFLLSCAHLELYQSEESSEACVSALRYLGVSLKRSALVTSMTIETIRAIVLRLIGYEQIAPKLFGLSSARELEKSDLLIEALARAVTASHIVRKKSSAFLGLALTPRLYNLGVLLPHHTWDRLCGVFNFGLFLRSSLGSSFLANMVSKSAFIELERVRKNSEVSPIAAWAVACMGHLTYVSGNYEATLQAYEFSKELCDLTGNPSGIGIASM
jgi:hypothetical protein